MSHRRTQRSAAGGGHRLVGDGGAFGALELAILVPFIVVMLLLIVAFGRVARGRELVDEAARSAARAGSLATSPGAARDAALRAATDTLAGGGLSCAAVLVDVDTTAFRPGGAVRVQVACSTHLAGLTLSGVPGTARLTATSTSPLEPYRQLDASGNP